MLLTELEMISEDLVAVIGPDGNPTDIVYKILEEDVGSDGEAYTRLSHSETGIKLKVHSNRVVKSETIGYEAKEVNETGENEMTDAKTETEKTETETEKPKKAKKAKAKKELEPFDMPAFVKENGGEHWIKGKVDKIKFDHEGYEVLTHAVLDEAKKVYRVFNTYSQNGVLSLGRGGKGITPYPLKGKTINYTVSKNAKKVESRGEKKQRKGTKTAEDVRKAWEKSGYQKQA